MDLNVPSASQCHLTTERETAGWETWGEGGDAVNDEILQLDVEVSNDKA